MPEERRNRRDLAGARAGGFAGTTRFARQLLQIGVLGAGAWLVIDGGLSPGSMIAASIPMGRALPPVDQAVSTWRSVSRVMRLLLRHAWSKADRRSLRCITI